MSAARIERQRVGPPVDADSELDPPLCGNVGVRFGHRVVDFDRASDRIDDARELDQQAVPGRLDDPAAMLGDLGIDQFASVCLEGCQRADFVSAHDPAVSGDIRRQNRSQPPLDTLLCH
jgi:hypothetical protein